jgi:hypothetical protein
MFRHDLGVKRPGRGADTLLLCNTEDKECWSQTSTRRISLHSLYMDSFTLYIYVYVLYIALVGTRTKTVVLFIVVTDKQESELKSAVRTPATVTDTCT